MQDLRDKLRKAGLVDKKEARKARTEARRKKKKVGGARVDAAREEQRRVRFEQKKAEDARAAREAQERKNEEGRLQEEQWRIRHVIERGALPRPGGNDRPFHFVGSDRRVRRFYTRFATCEQLASGQLAVVSAPYDELRDYRVVDRKVAHKLEEIAPGMILFWCKPPHRDDGLPTYGATGPTEIVTSS